MEKFFIINERVAVVAIKLNERYRLKTVQTYAPTAGYDEEAVNSFYEDVDSPIRTVKARFTMVKGGSNKKVAVRIKGEGNNERILTQTKQCKIDVDKV